MRYICIMPCLPLPIGLRVLLVQWRQQTCEAEIICDNVHIHPAVVRATFTMMGADRMILISDSMRATGMPDGTYTLAVWMSA